MQKKNFLLVFVISLALIGLMAVPVMASSEEGDGSDSKLSINGHIQFAAGYREVEEGDVDSSSSDLSMTSLELIFAAHVSEWVNAHAVLLYEGPLWAHDENHVEFEEAVITLGNTDEFPVYLSAGKMVVPFGAMQTHFPADPVVEAPLTLLFGETIEKAALVGAEFEGVSLCAYTFRGHWDTTLDDDDEVEDADIESYGADINYELSNDGGLELLVGASYISNIAEADHFEEHLATLEDDVDAAAAYLHVGIDRFFFEAEYMTALDDIEAQIHDLDAAGNPTLMDVEFEPEVFNIEVGVNLEVANKDIEVALKYAGSDDIAGLPEDRYGIAGTLEIFHETFLALALFHDEFEEDDNTADTLVAVLTVEF